MEKKYLKRLMSVLLALAMVAVFPFTFGQEANAASTKPAYVVKSQSEVAKMYKDGKLVGTEKYTYKYTYDKNCLPKTFTTTDGSKTVYTRNKKGDLTKTKRYGSDGKLEETNTYKNKYKKGLLVQRKMYYKPASGSKRLQSTSTYTYYSNGKTKKIVSKSEDGTTTQKFNKKGIEKSYKFVSKDGKSSYTMTYDSKGSLKKSVFKGTGYSDVTEHTTLKYKKGNLVKDVYTTKSSNTYDGKTTTTTNETATRTVKYTYDKHGNIKTQKETVTRKYDGHTSKSVYTYTYKYKKVNVPQKSWKFFF